MQSNGSRTVFESQSNRNRIAVVTTALQREKRGIVIAIFYYFKSHSHAAFHVVAVLVKLQVVGCIRCTLNRPNTLPAQPAIASGVAPTCSG